MKTYQLNKNTEVQAGKMVGDIYRLLGQGEKLVITVKKEAESRKDSQRQLGNIWYKDAAKSIGEDREIVRNRFFYLFAVPIFYRDQIIVNGVNSFDTLTAIYELKERGMAHECKILIRSFIANSTTNSFNVKQNAEYLTSIWNYCLNNNIHLSLPGDAEIAGFNP